MIVSAIKFTKKTAVFIIIGIAVMLAATVFVYSTPPEKDVGTAEGRISYLSSLGWEVDPQSEERQVIILPREFGDVMTEYNRMQLEQGFDLSKYAGRECVRYTYLVTNYPNGDRNVFAQLFICGGSVVGGDIHSTAMDGFMHGIKQI